jgi:hypothetical protein
MFARQSLNAAADDRESVQLPRYILCFVIGSLSHKSRPKPTDLPIHRQPRSTEHACRLMMLFRHLLLSRCLAPPPHSTSTTFFRLPPHFVLHSPIRHLSTSSFVRLPWPGSPVRTQNKNRRQLTMRRLSSCDSSAPEPLPKGASNCLHPLPLGRDRMRSSVAPRQFVVVINRQSTQLGHIS